MATVVTTYGNLTIVPIERDRLRIEAGIPQNVTDERLTINGVPHSAQGFMYLWSDGAWHFGREGDRVSQMYELSLKRTDKMWPASSDASRSAREKADKAICAAVNEWAARDTAQLDIARANEAWQAKQLASAEEKVAQAAKALEEAEAERERALGRLELARRHVRELES